MSDQSFLKHAWLYGRPLGLKLRCCLADHSTKTCSVEWSTSQIKTRLAVWLTTTAKNARLWPSTSESTLGYMAYRLSWNTPGCLAPTTLIKYAKLCCQILNRKWLGFLWPTILAKHAGLCGRSLHQNLPGCTADQYPIKYAGLGCRPTRLTETSCPMWQTPPAKTF